MNNTKSLSPFRYIFCSDVFSKGQRAFIAICLLMSLCAIAIFIWLIVDAANAHSARGILFGSSLVIGSLGLTAYSLMRTVDPRRSAIALWVTIPVAVAVAVVSLFVQGGASQPNIDKVNAEIRYERNL